MKLQHYGVKSRELEKKRESREEYHRDKPSDSVNFRYKIRSFNTKGKTGLIHYEKNLTEGDLHLYSVSIPKKASTRVLYDPTLILSLYTFFSFGYVSLTSIVNDNIHL